MEIYLAYSVLLTLWLLVVTPLIGSIFTTHSRFKIGIKVQIVIVALCALIGSVVWSLWVVIHQLL